MHRREFMKAAATAPLALLQPVSSPEAKICLFTDHLADFDYQEVATMLRQVGVGGADLTVRPGGLVKPERVVEDLPKAAAIFKANGLSIPMITTGITSVSDSMTQTVLTIAAKLGIGYYKLGYYPYENLEAWPSRLESTQRELKKLVDLGRRLSIQAGFHNHSGPFVGGSLWDSWQILQSLDPKWIGFYFDPGQATFEGGNNAWNLGFRRISEMLNMRVRDLDLAASRLRVRESKTDAGGRWIDLHPVLRDPSAPGASSRRPPRSPARPRPAGRSSGWPPGRRTAGAARA